MEKMRAARGMGLTLLVMAVLMAWQPIWGAPLPAVIGTVSGPGSIQLNGIAAPAGTLVYAGNQVETGPGSIGYITFAQGGKLVLDGSSSAQLSEGPHGVSVKLNHGVVAVLSETKSPIVVMAKGVTIRTKQPSGTFEVGLKGRTLKVFSKIGAVLARAANHSVEIDQAFLMTATLYALPSVTGQGAGQLGAVNNVAISKSSKGIGPAVPSSPPPGCNNSPMSAIVPVCG